MEFLRYAPRLTADGASELARRLFGWSGTALPLPSERDQNFRLTGPRGDRVLKVANATDERPLIEAQNAALRHVARKTALCPRVLPAVDGSDLALWTSSAGDSHIVRLLTWIDGTPLGAVHPRDEAVLTDVGRAVAELDTALDGFDHPAIHRDFHWDLARACDVVEAHGPLIRDPMVRTHVIDLAASIRARDGAVFAALRKAAVHNDPNDYNVLVSHSGRVTGVLDFGDIVFSYALADLAVAVAYAVLDATDPVEAACHVVAGCHAGRPLDDADLRALPGLVQLRLCASVAMAAAQQAERPDDAYLGISQGPVARTLPRLAAVPHERFVERLATVCRPARRVTPNARTEDLLAARRHRIGGNLSIAYRSPLEIVRGAGQYVFDRDGRRYLDGYNNVPHVGHAHPRVVEAAAAQLATLNTNTRYLHEGLARFAEALTETLPEPLRICYFVNSGSEANELALRLARAHTRRRDVVVLDAAYHGNTTTLIDISPYKFNGPGGEGAPPWVHVLPLPDVYRGEFRGDDPRSGEKYAEFARFIPNPGAFIAESAPSVGGQLILPPRYLASVYAIIRGNGGVCIADEVQTGYGRTGSDFYAFAAHGVTPDIVVLGKPIGNGYPLGAVVTSPEIAASFDNGMEFFSTFGGSTVSCAVGIAVLDVVQREGLQAHAARVGDALLARLRTLAGRRERIGDVRGAGLFLGVELVLDRDTREPATDLASAVVNGMRQRGVLIGTDGPYANVLKIRPPMPFSLADGEELVAVLDEVLNG